MLTEGSKPQSEEQTWTAVARLLRPQGRRGELLAEPLTNLAEVFSKGREFQLQREDAPGNLAQQILLEDCWSPQGRNSGRLVFKLAGVDTISAAEELEGCTLLLPEAEMPELETDTFFVRDLLGCTLVDGDAVLGTVTDLQFPIAADGHTRLPDAADLLVVAPSDQKGAETYLVPFVKAWLISVDLSTRTILMQLPEGLLG